MSIDVTAEVRVSRPRGAVAAYLPLAEGRRGAVFRNRVRGDVSGFFRVASPAMAPVVRRPIQGDGERLRDVLERG